MSYQYHYSLLSVIALAVTSSCHQFRDDQYDTGGYDTSNPYGVPSDGGYQSANPPAAQNPTYGRAAYEDAPAAGPVISTPPSDAASVPATAHTVARGDTLWGLSKKYNIPVSAIRAANNMTAGDNTIRIGQTLQIPAR